jgi:ethylbenzene dioxygenase beta subunit
MRTSSPLTPELSQQIADVLIYEAELLDRGRFREWFELLTEDVIYRVPVRVTRQGDEFSSEAWHMNETWDSLRTRIARLETAYAWAEDPPSRTRRFVTNIRVRPGQRPEEVEVISNLLLYRNQGESPSFHLLSAERQDIWRHLDGRWRLARRLVLLDHTVLGTHNLAIFL